MSLSAVSYGGGVNSVAVCVGLVERGELPDLVMFADTGGERPETYAHVAMMFDWLKGHGIECVTVRNQPASGDKTLEENCLRRKELPSLAYGFKGCSVKWKRQPMDRFLRYTYGPAMRVLECGGKVTRIIGIDAGETRRAKLPPDEHFIYRYPLVEWGWDRDACHYAIERAGLPQPPKSSCFFCPAMRKKEIRDLMEKHPDLYQRALAIEANAQTHTVAGLGRNWKWSSLADDKQLEFKFPETASPCDCMDGDDDA